MNRTYFANTVDARTGEESIRLVVEATNTDPTLSLFHEVKRAAQEGPQSESREQQHRGTDQGWAFAEASGSHCIESGAQEKGTDDATT
jgi:hypothetical protein